MPERIAISAGIVVPLNGPPIKNGAVIISDGKIESVLKSDELPEDIRRDDYPNGILMPAFVNAHTHLALTKFRGVADDKNFVPWLNEIINLSLPTRENECREGVELGIRQNFRSGITAIGDNHYLPYAREAMIANGMKGVNFLEFYGIRTLNLSGAIERYRIDIRKAVDGATKRNRIGLSPHATYTVPPPIARLVAEQSKALNLPLSMHVAETRDEMRLFMHGDGPLYAISRYVKLPKPDGKRTPLKYFDDFGLINERAIIIHGVHLSDDDIGIIADAGATIVSCPTSNAKLGCGIARAGVWKNRGVRICIATDSPASGDSYDLLEEMRRFVLMQRALTMESESFSAEDVVRMVTVNAAEALGMSEMVGDFREGSCADMILLEPDISDVSENRDVFQTIVWGCHQTDIVKVWADGREVYAR